eukprot:CAMPEP_0197736994 /NCGR_PEP_ID=MMETSP1435-20131217/6327_1 /TAXON_ID=426625 /ORGANISM="Chaetoceros brevis, Strain CCMP164" /LENGTH=129 /DNA_ID=CAMNT_0043325341 /DNA_START=18 /DNA_END=407 /DNA_ORIENTATION=+
MNYKEERSGLIMTSNGERNVPIVKCNVSYQSIERGGAKFSEATELDQDQHHAVRPSKKILFLVGSFLFMAVMSFRSGAAPGAAALVSQAMEQVHSTIAMVMDAPADELERETEEDDDREPEEIGDDFPW